MMVQADDLLLEWMTHMGSGTWLSFREAAAETFARSDIQALPYLLRKIRAAMSEMGHADFFVEGTKRWVVLRPAIVQLAEAEQFLFVGGRTRPLVRKLEAVCRQLGLSMEVEARNYGPTLIRLTGQAKTMEQAAKDAGGVVFVPHAAANLSARLIPVLDSLAKAPVVPEPIGWMARSWSFSRLDWIDGLIARTVREYRNRFGVNRYLVHTEADELREVDRRVALYCAASQRAKRIVKYRPSQRCLAVPVWAPLPSDYGRVVCLSTGFDGVEHDGYIEYENVDLNTASLVSVGLGQGFPTEGAAP